MVRAIDDGGADLDEELSRHCFWRVCFAISRRGEALTNLENESLHLPIPRGPAQPRIPVAATGLGIATARPRKTRYHGDKTSRYCGGAKTKDVGILLEVVTFLKAHGRKFRCRARAKGWAIGVTRRVLSRRADRAVG